jgi:hypothetical protein
MPLVSFDPPSPLASVADWRRFEARVRSWAAKLPAADQRDVLKRLNEALRQQASIEPIDFKE